LNLRRYDEATDALDRAAALAPAEWRYQYYLAQAHENRGDWEAAERAYAAAIQLRDDDASLHRELARLFTKQNRRRAAVQSLSRAVTLSPRWVTAQYELGMAQWNAGDVVAAERTLSLVVQLDDAHGPAHFQLGVIAANAGRLNEAATEYERACRLLPDFAPPRTNLGNVLQSLGHTSAAEAVYKDALRIDPHSAQAHYHLGLLLHRRGQHDEARWHINKAHELGL
jgi:Flp pilus assembly protein TadD